MPRGHPVTEPTDPRRRFWRYVTLGNESGCWTWSGPRTVAGYGKFGVARREVYAHRFAYESLVGPIPVGLQIDHLCRVRHCVNPDHLEPVTNHENTLRGARASRTHCSRGHAYSETARIYRGYRRCRECAKEYRREHQGG